MKKIKMYSEIVYIIAQLGLTLAVAMMAAADFGISVIVAPAYIISQRFTVFTFGQWNYILQGVLFVVFCFAIRKFKLIYVVSFITCVLYGTILDMWRAVIPLLNPNITPPGSMDLWVRIVLFVMGELLIGFTVMLFLKSYIYPQVCDLFVKGIAEKCGWKQVSIKRIYDLGCLIIAGVLSFVLLKDFSGIKWGTVVIALITGVIMGYFAKIYDKFFETVSLFPKIENLFKL